MAKLIRYRASITAASFHVGRETEREAEERLAAKLDRFLRGYGKRLDATVRIEHLEFVEVESRYLSTEARMKRVVVVLRATPGLTVVELAERLAWGKSLTKRLIHGMTRDSALVGKAPPGGRRKPMRYWLPEQLTEEKA